MKKYNIRKMLPVALPSFAILTLSTLSTKLFLRNLGVILAMLLPADENAEFDFPLIFEQLRDASISLHLWVPLACAAGFGLLAFWVFKRGKNRIAGYITVPLSFITLFLVAFFSLLLLTSVNGIRFCDLLSKLIPLIDKL